MANSPLLICRYSDNESRIDAHFHNAYEILFVKSGVACVKVDSHEYIVKENQLVFISNFEEHFTRIIEAPYKRYFATFDTHLLDKLVGDAKLMSMLKNRPDGFVHRFDVGELGGLVEKLFLLLMNEKGGEEKFSNDMVAAAVKQILILVYRGAEESFPPPLKNMKSEIYEVQHYIEEHFTEDIQIAAVAEKFYINTYYLSHCFKELTGYSPKQYLLLNRLSKAKELLIHSDLSVSEISFKSGFSDTNNFIRYFKKEVGLTPNKYRNA